MLKQKKLLISFLSLAVAQAFVVGCGQQAFEPVKSLTTSSAPGTFYIPPKVDILLAEDDTGSMDQAYGSISQQLPAFLTSLQASNFDYHFAITPLTTVRSMSQVVGSQYENNWGSQWLSPFPGAVEANVESVTSGYFAFPSSYSGYVTQNAIVQNNSEEGSEPGFQTIYTSLTQPLPGHTSGPIEAQYNGFLRPDALLVIFVVGNGDDTSGVNYCKIVEGNGNANDPSQYTLVPCEDVAYCQGSQSGPTCRSTSPSSPYYGSAASSFASYLTKFQQLKASPAQVQFYAAAAQENSSSCLGSRAYANVRYDAMASALGGSSFDICSTPINTLLTELQASITSSLLTYQSDYVFMNAQPDPSTIVVTKYPGGNIANAETIPNDPNNGWTYNAASEPLPPGTCAVLSSTGFCINSIQQTSYGVVLHGSAILHGLDSANIAFTPLGLQPSAK